MPPIVSRLIRKTKTFLAAPLWVQLGFVPTYLLLGIAKFLIFNIPFRTLAPHLGLSRAPAPWLPLISPSQEQRARLISRLVQMTAKYTPWTSNCFPQAIVAKLLLGLYRMPYIIYFGVQRDQATGAMKAHAWVVSGRVRVTGGFSFDQFTVVGQFVAPTLGGL